VVERNEPRDLAAPRGKIAAAALETALSDHQPKQTRGTYLFSACRPRVEATPPEAGYEASPVVAVHTRQEEQEVRTLTAAVISRQHNTFSFAAQSHFEGSSKQTTRWYNSKNDHTSNATKE
jgi:hypothetical protein